MGDRDLVINTPLEDHWAIFNPPGHPKLAYDFLAVDDNKSPYKRGGLLRHLVSFIRVDDTYTWSRPVFSPVDGRVSVASDGSPDRERINMVFDLISLLLIKPEEKDGFSGFGGNHIILNYRDSYILFAHLKRGSLTVQSGDTVTCGQKIGEVGNSGASLQPHLHLQIMSSENPFPLFRNLIPYRFRTGKVKVKDRWEIQKDFALKNGAQFLFDSKR